MKSRHGKSRLAVELSDLPPLMRRQAEAQLAASRNPTSGAGSEKEQTKPAKYRNTEVQAGGLTFKSKFEYQRSLELAAQAAAGVITELRMHPIYPLHALAKDGTRVRLGIYEADFEYRVVALGGQFVVEDVKSKVTMTPIYRWKAAHLLAEYGYRVQEVQRRKRR